jgi:glutamate--cysteine ligase
MLWHESTTLEDYVRWAVAVPMFFVKRGEKVLRNTGQTFEDYVNNGFEGEHATQADWELHLSTLFPEVRIKRTIEVRGADAPPVDLYLAVPALWKGLLYDEKTLDAGLALTEKLTHEEVATARPEILKNGLRATLAGQSVQWWAEHLLELSKQGLQRASLQNATGSDESTYLKALTSLVAKGQSPADVFRAELSKEGELRCGSRALELNRFC